jgi:hypothetical protein
MTRLIEITKKELEEIPEDKWISALVPNVYIEGTIEGSVGRACPLNRAHAFVLGAKGQRSFSDCLGHRVYDDNFESDMENVRRAEGLSRDVKLISHGFGLIDIYAVTYVAFLDEQLVKRMRDKEVCRETCEIVKKMKARGELRPTDWDSSYTI